MLTIGTTALLFLKLRASGRSSGGSKSKPGGGDLSTSAQVIILWRGRDPPSHYSHPVAPSDKGALGAHLFCELPVSDRVRTDSSVPSMWQRRRWHGAAHVSGLFYVGGRASCLRRSCWKWSFGFVSGHGQNHGRELTKLGWRHLLLARQLWPQRRWESGRGNEWLSLSHRNNRSRRGRRRHHKDFRLPYIPGCGGWSTGQEEHPPNHSRALLFRRALQWSAGVYHYTPAPRRGLPEPIKGGRRLQTGVASDRFIMLPRPR